MTVEGLTTPLFVCVGTRDLCVVSYWIDTLVLKNWGKYFANLRHHPFLSRENQRSAQEVARDNLPSGPFQQWISRPIGARCIYTLPSYTSLWVHGSQDARAQWYYHSCQWSRHSTPRQKQNCIPGPRGTVWSPRGLRVNRAALHGG